MNQKTTDAAQAVIELFLDGDVTKAAAAGVALAKLVLEERAAKPGLHGKSFSFEISDAPATDAK